MKRIIAWAVAAVTAAALLTPVKVAALSAEKYILLDAQTGRVLESRNADSRSLIASTTKIMTALVVSRQCNVLSRVRVPKEAVGIEGSSMYLREGEVLTVQELLYGLMLRSGNDAAVALAIYCGGSVEGFAQLMNDQARRLGLHDTHFVNPHGLDAPGHYSTAADLAKLAAFAMEDAVFAMTVSARNVRVGERYLQNHNKLLWQLEGADGVKTGYTKAAGRILVSSATRNGRRLICVTINAPDDWNDHKSLHEKGFSRFTTRQLIYTGDVLGTAKLAGGTAEDVSLVATEDVYYPLAQGEVVTIEIPGSGFVYAPVCEGESAGYAHVLVDGKAVAKVQLVYGASAERLPERRSIIDKILDILRN